jgi:hypothetical protein
MSDNGLHPVRLFKTGSTLISESADMHRLSITEVRQRLQHIYPEVAHATIRETPQADGTLLVEFLPVAGRKG